MDTDEKLFDLLSRLGEITRCQVCLEQLTANTSQCITGHGICNRCRRRINVCPSCKQRFLSNKPTMLVQVLEALPKLCPFNDDGCKQIVSFNEDHKVVCGYRSFKCPVSGPRRCVCNYPVRCLQDHFIKHHNSHLASYSLGNPKKIFYHGFNGEWLQEGYLHCVDNNFFLVSAFKDRTRESFVQSVRHIPLGLTEETYYFTVTISKEEIIYKHLLKAVPYDEDEQITLSPHCMAVPLEEMTGLLDENGHLEVYFEATKKLNGM